MSKPSKETLLLMQERTARLAEWLRILLSGEDVPQEVIDKEVRWTFESTRQYQRERAAASN